MAGAIATCMPSRNAAKVSEPGPGQGLAHLGQSGRPPRVTYPEDPPAVVAGRADHRVEALQQGGGPVQKIRIDLGTAHEEDRGVIRPGFGERMLRPARQRQNMHILGIVR